MDLTKKVFIIPIIFLPLFGCQPITPAILPTTIETKTSAFLPQLCGDNQAEAYTWEDNNSNGINENDEPPLAGVCISARYFGNEELLDNDYCYKPRKPSATLYSRDNGFWISSNVAFGGCYTTLEKERKETEEKDQCRRIFITAFTPPGYIPTTPIEVNDCRAKFGFHKEI